MPNVIALVHNGPAAMLAPWKRHGKSRNCCPARTGRQRRGIGRRVLEMESERWEQVAGLHRAALEREEGQRADFLRGACGGDKGLLQEVESLLASEKEGKSFMELPAKEAAARVVALEEARQPVPLSTGTRLGPYEILAPIGAGGMGEVYRARDPRIGREVAIKVLPAAFASDIDRLRRFEQEVRAAGALSHPNILAIFDVGHENGSPFIVSELLEGVTLRERMRAGSIPTATAIEYGREVARGLAAAH